MSIEIKKIEAIEVCKHELGLINCRCISTDTYKVGNIVKIYLNDAIAIKTRVGLRTIVGSIAYIHDDYLELDMSEKYNRMLIDIPFNNIMSIELHKEE